MAPLRGPHSIMAIGLLFQKRMSLKRACSAFLLVSVCAQAQIKHFQRVDDHIYRGSQPQPPDFPVLARMGIRTVLDLRGGPIHKPRERKLVEAAGMHYISIRLSGIWEPKDRQIAQILEILQDPSRAPIFVHCRRGIDRVEEVIACYRIEHDRWPNRQALAEARINPLELLMRHYILHFDRTRVAPLLTEQHAERY
jgi:tyrosine-protein phosphatase SIW14